MRKLIILAAIAALTVPVAGQAKPSMPRAKRVCVHVPDRAGDVETIGSLPRGTFVTGTTIDLTGVSIATVDGRPVLRLSLVDVDGPFSPGADMATFEVSLRAGELLWYVQAHRFGEEAQRFRDDAARYGFWRFTYTEDEGAGGAPIAGELAGAVDVARDIVTIEMPPPVARLAPATRVEMPYAGAAEGRSTEWMRALPHVSARTSVNGPWSGHPNDGSYLDGDRIRVGAVPGHHPQATYIAGDGAPDRAGTTPSYRVGRSC